MELGAIWSQCFPEFSSFPQEEKRNVNKECRDLVVLLRKGETDYASPGVILRENTISPSCPVAFYDSAGGTWIDNEESFPEIDHFFSSL